MKKITAAILGALMLCLCACSAATADDPCAGDVIAFNAEITEITDGTVTVTPDKDSAEYKTADSFVVSTPEDTVYLDADENAVDRAALAVGQTVEVVYSGDIAESYPAQIRGFKITVLKAAPLAPEPLADVGETSPLHFLMGDYSCSVDIPVFWNGIYEYSTHEKGVSFVSANNKEFGGSLFSIWAVTAEELSDPDFFSMCDGTPVLLSADETGGVSFYLVRAYTDVEFSDDETLMAEYMSMLACEDAIGKSFKWNNGKDDPTITCAETITFTVEGEEETVPATTRFLPEFGILVPTKGWYETAAVDGSLICTPEDNTDVSVTLSVYKTVLTDEAMANVEKDFGKLEWSEWIHVPKGGNTYQASVEKDGLCRDFYLVEFGADTYAISSVYPAEAAEGFGARSAQMAATMVILSELDWSPWSDDDAQ